MSFQRLEQLAKEHALEGKHKGTRLYMSTELSGRIMLRYKPDLGEAELIRLRNAVFGAPLLYQLMGIPIINDVEMVDDPSLWILVDQTGEEIERGRIFTMCPHGYDYGEYCHTCAGTGVVSSASASENPERKSSGA